MPATTTPSWCKLGWHGRGAGSSSTSFRPIAPLSTRSSGYGLMHRHVTHNRCHATFADFKAAILTFLREEVPGKWDTYCDQVTDNFRIISPKDFRVLT